MNQIKAQGSVRPFLLSGFTLLELLTVIAILATLAMLILPAVSRAKAASQTAVCRHNLGQIGRAMAMYLGDHNRYPPLQEFESFGTGQGVRFTTWVQRLFPQNPMEWTNASRHCPSYLARGGLVFQKVDLPPPGVGLDARLMSSSYAFNVYGMIRNNVWPKLGLGTYLNVTAEQSIQAPSEMYSVADARAYRFEGDQGFTGFAEMQPWLGLGEPGFRFRADEISPPHSQGYNLLFADWHVMLVRRKDYLFPPRAAQHWNRDNQPHPKLWAPRSEWVVQK